MFLDAHSFIFGATFLTAATPCLPAVELGPEGEELKLALFSEYLEAEQQEKFEGSFQDFLHAIDREDMVAVRACADMHAHVLPALPCMIVYGGRPAAPKQPWGSPKCKKPPRPDVRQSLSSAFMRMCAPWALLRAAAALHGLCIQHAAAA